MAWNFFDVLPLCSVCHYPETLRQVPKVSLVVLAKHDAGLSEALQVTDSPGNPSDGPVNELPFLI